MSCTGEFSEQEVRKLKCTCCMYRDRGHAWCSDFLKENTASLVFGEGGGGRERKKGLGISHMDVAYPVYKTNNWIGFESFARLSQSTLKSNHKKQSEVQ